MPHRPCFISLESAEQPVVCVCGLTLLIPSLAGCIITGGAGLPLSIPGNTEYLLRFREVVASYLLHSAV